MKHPALSGLALTLAAAFAHAGPSEDLTAAAAKVAAAPSYAWTVTMEFANSQFPAVPVQGVTEKGGCTLTTMTFNGNTRQTVRQGENVVTQNREGEWMTMEELRQQFAPNSGGGGAGGATGGGQGGRGAGRGGFGLLGGGGMREPARDAQQLAGKLRDLKIADGAITGDLAAEDAAGLLAFGRGGRGGNQPAPGVKNASATARFWLKDGALAKYAVSVKGTVTTPNGDEREVDLTTTTEFAEVGTAKVAIPEAARKKLGL
ncbi:MAG: hypothetical protein HZC55_24705 [Verrucomicrobia bacterium]|nr:hypothetical protein [Verrucomicrobiota bacterium]